MIDKDKSYQWIIISCVPDPFRSKYYLNPYSNPWNFPPSFYLVENWGSWKLSNLLEVTQPISEGAWIERWSISKAWVHAGKPEYAMLPDKVTFVLGQ